VNFSFGLFLPILSVQLFWAITKIFCRIHRATRSIEILTSIQTGYLDKLFPLFIKILKSKKPPATYSINDKIKMVKLGFIWLLNYLVFFNFSVATGNWE